MARLDQGYKRAAVGGRSQGGGRRGQALSTYLAQTKKGQVADLYVRTQTRGILDILGLEGGFGSDIAMSIKQMLRDEATASKQTKAALGAGVITAQNLGRQAQDAETQIKYSQEAESLLGALYSATRMRERADLEDGDLLDDPASLVADGSGWADEAAGRREIRKHVSLAIDNSGSTHMAETGYCSKTMQHVAENLMRVLFGAASEYPGISYDAFSFNRVTVQQTGRPGKAFRERLVRNYFEGLVVDDPLQRDAVETNLAPLIEAMYTNEEALGLIGQPRLDLILTDGEFESDADAEEAAEWQRRRGPGVTSYVLDLCPGEVERPVELPHQFRVIPLACMADKRGRKQIDEGALRQSLMRIAIEEVSKLQ